MQPKKHDDEQEQDLPHMDNGGLLDDFEVNKGATSTVQGAAPAPAPGGANFLDMAANFGGKALNAAFPELGLAKNLAETLAPAAQATPQLATGADPSGTGPKPAPVAAPNALTQKASAPKALPGMPPDVTPDELERYLGRQRQSIEKYGPDRQFDQEMSSLRARTSPGMALAGAGATFADGIMQGVARAGDPGFSRQQQDQVNQVSGEAAGALERARKGSGEQVEAEQKIDAIDPKSVLSQAYQKAFAPIFVQMGYNPKSVGSMPASQIQTLADLGVRYADAQTQLALKKAMLEVQTLTAQANISNQQSQRHEEALKTLEGMPWYSRLMHPGISGALSKEAGLDEGAGASHPQAAEALRWIQQNPNDPRAAQIRKRLGQ